MKHFILFAFNFILCVVCLAFCLDLKNYTDTMQEETRREMAQMCEVINAQNKTIEQYKNYCDNVARCIVEGAW